MLRYLTERLPVMVTPKWVETRYQPIAGQRRAPLPGRLRGAAGGREPAVRHRRPGRPDLRGDDAAVHRGGRAAGPGPGPGAAAPPRLSSLWVGLVTPVPAGLARPLVESLRNEVVCAEHDIAEYVHPADGLLPISQAIALALRHTAEGDVSTRWSSAGTPGAPSDPLPSDPASAGGSLFVDDRSSVVQASPEALWRVIEGIGGETGWYSFPLAWAVRGLMDRLAGGVGLRRGGSEVMSEIVGPAGSTRKVGAFSCWSADEEL